MTHGLTTAGGAVRRTGVTEYPACRSFGLDVGYPDYFGPLFSFGSLKLPKFVGRHWHRRTAEFGKTRLQPGQDGIHCPVQRVDDFRWRAFRCHDSIPNAASL